MILESKKSIFKLSIKSMKYSLFKIKLRITGIDANDKKSIKKTINEDIEMNTKSNLCLFDRLFINFLNVLI